MKAVKPLEIPDKNRIRPLSFISSQFPNLSPFILECLWMVNILTLTLNTVLYWLNEAPVRKYNSA